MVFAVIIFSFLVPLGWGAPAKAENPTPATGQGQVVKVADLKSVTMFTADANRVRKMFNAALMQLTGTRDVGAAWKTLVKPGDRVGVKVHTYPGAVMSSRRSVVETILDGLELAGVARDRMIIFDRYAPQMEAANYDPGQRPDGVVIAATVPDEGYDPKAMVSIPIPGKLIWGDLEFKREVVDVLDDDNNSRDQISTKSYFSKILTQRVDKVVNVGVPITDPHLGVYGCQLSSSLSLIDNYRRLQRPSFTREDSLTDVFANPAIQKKYVLYVLDALMAQYAGGPGFDPTYCWPLGTIYLSHDAVALDALALKMINQQRPKAELGSVTEQAAYIKAAAAEGLGIADPDKIQIVDVPITW